MKKSTPKKLSNKSKAKPSQTWSRSKHLFKRKEETKKLLEFPSILRIFTEKYFLASLVSFFLVAIIIIVGLDLYRNIKQKEEIDKERQEIISKIQYWQGIINKYKDYRDGYFQLAVLEYRLGYFGASKFYLDKALTIDPNFDKGRELEKVLSSKY